MKKDFVLKVSRNRITGDSKKAYNSRKKMQTIRLLNNMLYRKVLLIKLLEMQNKKVKYYLNY